MSKSSFITAIGDSLGILAQVVRNGFESYASQYSATSEVHSKRSQRSLVHDHMIRAGDELLPQDRFRHVVSGQRHLFNFQNSILIQFKKLKRNLTTSNYPTRQALLFEEVGEVEGLPGIPSDLPLVTVGYIPTQYFAGIEAIFATRTVNRRPLWSLRLDENEDERQIITSILPPYVPIQPKVPRQRIKRRSEPRRRINGS